MPPDPRHEEHGRPKGIRRTLGNIPKPSWCIRCPAGPKWMGLRLRSFAQNGIGGGGPHGVSRTPRRTETLPNERNRWKSMDRWSPNRGGLRFFVKRVRRYGPPPHNIQRFGLFRSSKVPWFLLGQLVRGGTLPPTDTAKVLPTGIKFKCLRRVSRGPPRSRVVLTGVCV